MTSRESGENLYYEFFTTFTDFIRFRRGLEMERTPTGSKIAWEEFEDYYLTINGCFDDTTFVCTLERCWDCDKPKVEATTIKTLQKHRS